MKATHRATLILSALTGIGLFGCSLLYGPLTGPHPGNCNNNPDVCTGTQQCDEPTGTCVQRCTSASDCETGLCDALVCAALPTVTTLTPGQVPTAGGVDVTITGANFAAAVADVTVKFGTLTGVVKQASATSLVVTTPANLGKSGPVDVVIANKSGGMVTRTNGITYYFATPTFAARTDLVLPGSALGGGEVATGDLDGDGNLDLVAASSSSSSVSVLLGKGDGTFNTRTDYGVGINVDGVAVADVNGDNKPDVVAANSGANTLTVFLNKGDGTGDLNVGVSLMTASGPSSVAVGDFDGDKRQDLIVGHASDPKVRVLPGNGDGTFKAHIDNPGLSSGSVTLGDVNGDGKTDVCATTAQTANGFILLGNGNGTLQAPVLLGTGSNGTRACAFADFNADGKLDVAFSTTGTLLHVFTGKGDGTFNARADYTTSSDNFAIRSVDLNGDGFMDLLAASSDSSEATIHFNQGNGTFAPITMSLATTGPLRSVAYGDFNKDGKPDVVGRLLAGSSLSLLLNTSQ